MTLIEKFRSDAKKISARPLLNWTDQELDDLLQVACDQNEAWMAYHAGYEIGCRRYDSRARRL